MSEEDYSYEYSDDGECDDGGDNQDEIAIEIENTMYEADGMSLFCNIFFIRFPYGPLLIYNRLSPKGARKGTGNV
jgi:hypothetical protein